MALYPINVNIADQLCVVIGGGTVAVRKVHGLLHCGAKVRIVSPKILPEIQVDVHAKRLEWLPRAYAQGDLKGASFVFALTDCYEAQRQIVEEARLLSIPVNVADNPEACTFHVPATIRRGDFLISISTGGGSPSLAAAIRKELEEQYGTEYGVLVTMLTEIRKQVMNINKYASTRESFDTVDTHKTVFVEIDYANILSLLQHNEWQVLRQHLQEILPPGIDANYIVSLVDHI